MVKEDVIIYNFEKKENYMITETLLNVKKTLDEQGFCGIDQIVGYLLNGDLSYITDYKDCKNKLSKISRDEILEALLKDYLRDIEWDI